MIPAVNQPTSEIVIYAGIYVKTYRIADAGTYLPQHSHPHPHITYVVSGMIQAWQDDVDAPLHGASDVGVAHQATPTIDLGTFTAPSTIKIEADIKHTFQTMTDNVVLACIHAIDNADPDTVPDDYEPPVAEHHEFDFVNEDF